MASVMTGVKDFCRFGHPQDNGGEQKGQLLSGGKFYIFGIIMMCLFLACFFYTERQQQAMAGHLSFTHAYASEPKLHAYGLCVHVGFG